MSSADLSADFTQPQALWPCDVDVWYKLFTYVVCYYYLSLYVAIGWRKKYLAVPAEVFDDLWKINVKLN